MIKYLILFISFTISISANVTVPESVKEVIKQFEGWRSSAYKDVGGKHYAIGYGFSTTDLNKQMTRAEGNRIFDKKISIIESKVKSIIKVPINQNQLSVIVDLVYNCGFGKIKKSTLIKHLNNSDYDLAGLEIKKWCKAGGKTLRGLVKRRAWNYALWNESPQLAYSKIEYYK